jgi:uncharacterized protein (TIGR03437 family)
VVSIFGSRLGPLDALTATLQSASTLANQLGDTQVFFDNTPGALFYAQDSQINAQVPFEVAGRTAVKVEVRVKGLAVGSVTIPIASAAPGLFTWNGGTGPVIAMNGDASLNGAAAPAAKSSAVILFATGGGPTNPSGVDGRIPDTHPAQLVLPVSATVGGQPASVTWAGEVPGSAGITQFQIVIPSNATPGAQPVAVTIAGYSSQSGVVLYIQ